MKSLLFLAFITVQNLFSAEMEEIKLSPPENISKASIYVWQGIKNPKAVLVLCPGANGNGELLIKQPEWQNFALEHKLGLVGIHFVSKPKLLISGQGYYYAQQGSGKLLLDAIDTIYGKDTPLLFYGFSGGAHFTSRFTEWCPERVITWAAYSAAWWDQPQQRETSPPGIVACGEYDGARYGASYVYYKKGRAMDKPWLWVSLEKTGHTRSENLEKFIREYFSEILEKPKSAGLWVNIEQEKIAGKNEHKVLRGWLPSKQLFHQWNKIHYP